MRQRRSAANIHLFASANTALSLPTTCTIPVRRSRCIPFSWIWRTGADPAVCVRWMRPRSARAKMGDVAAPDAEPEAVLPNWLEEMMEPGVGAGVFLTLKLALIGLVATLCLMLSFAEDLTIRFHLKVFLGLASVLTVIVLWFISELKKDADGACGKAPKDAGAKKAQ